MAEYTRFTDEDVSSILALYGLSFSSYSLIAGGMANTSYLIDGSHVLTALDNHDAASAAVLVDTMRHIEANGIFTPQPVGNLRGAPIEIYQGRPIILKPYLSTRTPLTPEGDRAPGVGTLLSRLHSVPVPGFLHHHGRRIPERALDVLEGRDCDDLKAAIERARGAGFQAVMESYPIAICHGDLMGDNVIERPDGELVPIDWETATVDTIILDLGIAAVSAVKLGLDVPTFASALVDGYRLVGGHARIDVGDVVRATAYGCALMSYHRYVRQHINFPDPAKADIYKQLLPFAMA